MKNNPLHKLNEILLTLNPIEFTTLAYLIGIILSQGLNYNEIQSLGNFYEQIGQTLLTIGQQAQTLNIYAPDETINNCMQTLKNKIGNIESIIAEFKL